MLFSSLTDRTWFIQLRVGHNPNMAQGITGQGLWVYMFPTMVKWQCKVHNTWSCHKWRDWIKRDPCDLHVCARKYSLASMWVWVVRYCLAEPMRGGYWDICQNLSVSAVIQLVETAGALEGSCGLQIRRQFDIWTARDRKPGRFLFGYSITFPILLLYGIESTSSR